MQWHIQQVYGGQRMQADELYSSEALGLGILEPTPWIKPELEMNLNLKFNPKLYLN